MQFYKRAIFFLMSLVYLSAWMTADNSMPEITIQTVDPQCIILRVTGDQQKANVIALRSKAGIIVIDSQSSPRLGSQIRKSIRDHFNTDHFVALLNTHGHGDHCWGNEAFKDIQIIAQENAIQTMERTKGQRASIEKGFPRMIEGMKGKLSLLDPTSAPAESLRQRINYYNAILGEPDSPFQLTLPTSLVTTESTRSFGDLTLDLMWFGHAHSEGDMVIYCREKRLLLTGDLFFSTEPLYIDSQRVKSANQWKKTFAQIDSWDIATIIPGHGEIIDKDIIAGCRASTLAELNKLKGKKSAYDLFLRARDRWGMAKALKILQGIKSMKNDYFFLPPEFDALAISLMQEEKLDQAILAAATFTELFPESYLVWDTLGEIYLKKEDWVHSAACFKRSLELDPNNKNAQRRLDELKKRSGDSQ